jgi:ribonuclease P protein component
LTPAARFSTVFRIGTASRSGGITVLRAPAPTGPPQVGFVAARRVGTAVERNRAKRRLREAMMNVELEADTAYVVIASPGVLTMGFDNLIDHLTRAVSAIGEADSQ